MRAIVATLCIVLMSLLVTANASSLVASSKGLTDISCGECKDIVSVVYGIAENRIALNTTIDILIGICNSKFANDTTKREECVLIMKLADGLLPLLFDGMNDLAWDIPLTFCANIVKVCYEPCCEAGAPPQEIFINFADSTDLTQMRVTWITLNETEGAAVEWWRAPSGAVQVAREATRTYTAGGWIGVIHSAVMTGLAPDTAYAYRVGSSQHGWSGNLSFRTLPTAIGVPSRPLRVLQIADMGYANFSDATTDRIADYVSQGKVDLIIHNGDISYADADEQHWDLFFKKMQPSFSSVPYMTTPGNHEFYWNFTAYQARLGMSMPAPVPSTGTGSMYYTLNIAGLVFVFLDSESYIDTGNLNPMQMQWFQNFMATVDRSTASPLVTVAQHRPLYCETCSDILSKILRDQSEAIFNREKIDLHLSGHMHNYQRMYPVVNNTVTSTNYTNPTTPVYILNGAAGNREGQEGFRKSKPFLANGSADYGFSYLTYQVDASTRTATIDFEFIVSETGAVGDAFTLVKNY